MFLLKFALVENPNKAMAVMSMKIQNLLGGIGALKAAKEKKDAEEAKIMQANVAGILISKKKK